MSSDNRASVVFPLPNKDYEQFTEENAGNIKPPRPPKSNFKVFGKMQYEEEKPIEGDTSYLERPPLIELRRINHEILSTYKKLFSILSEGNENPEPHLNKIKELFLQAHQILHKLRNAQAYEHMDHCLKEQKKQLDNFKENFDAKLLEIEQLKPP